MRKSFNTNRNRMSTSSSLRTSTGCMYPTKIHRVETPAPQKDGTLPTVEVELLKVDEEQLDCVYSFLIKIGPFKISYQVTRHELREFYRLMKNQSPVLKNVLKTNRIEKVPWHFSKMSSITDAAKKNERKQEVVTFMKALVETEELIGNEIVHDFFKWKDEIRLVAVAIAEAKESAKMHEFNHVQGYHSTLLDQAFDCESTAEMKFPMVTFPYAVSFQYKPDNIFVGSGSIFGPGNRKYFSVKAHKIKVHVEKWIVSDMAGNAVLSIENDERLTVNHIQQIHPSCERHTGEKTRLQHMLTMTRGIQAQYPDGIVPFQVECAKTSPYNFTCIEPQRLYVGEEYKTHIFMRFFGKSLDKDGTSRSVPLFDYKYYPGFKITVNPGFDVIYMLGIACAWQRFYLTGVSVNRMAGTICDGAEVSSRRRCPATSSTSCCHLNQFN